MRIETITDNYIKHFFSVQDFCDQAEIDNRIDTAKNKDLCQTTLNMSAEHWTTNTNSLMHRLYVKKDFSNNNGALVAVYENDRIVAVSSITKLDNKTALGGRRTFILKGHRGRYLFVNGLLPPQLDWAKSNNIERVLLAVNQYNKSVYRLMRRIVNSQSLLGIDPNNYLRKFKEMPDLQEIKGVQQHVFYYDLC